jgi:UDP-glucuronate decarboxylase
VFGAEHNVRRVIPMFTFEALNGRAVPVHGDGKQTRTFCYITGFLRILLKGRHGEAYNIGNANNEISMADLAKMFSSVVPGSSLQYISYPDTYPDGEPQRRCPDLTKAANELGYASQEDLQAGLARFVGWASEQGSYRG